MNQDPDRISVEAIKGMLCETCFYWSDPWAPLDKSGIPLDASGRAMHGTCRRSSPLPAVVPGVEGVTALWPTTHAGDVCGEWHTDQEPPASLGLAEIA